MNMPIASPNMFSENEEYVDSVIGSLFEDNSNVKSFGEHDNSDCSAIQFGKSFSTKTSTPIKDQNVTTSVLYVSPPILSNESDEQRQRCINLRSELKVIPSKRKKIFTVNKRYEKVCFSRATNSPSSDSSQSTDDESDVKDKSFIYNSNPTSRQPIFLDLSYFVIVEDKDHVNPIASPEYLKDVSETFLKSLEPSSSRNQDGNPSAFKRKLWTPIYGQDCVVKSPFKDQEPKSSSIVSENKEIKLKVPIPTYLIPAKFRKKQTNGVYSPVTANILNTPKSINRLKKQNLNTNVRGQICGFLESLDADIVPELFSDPNALHYRKTFKRTRYELLDRLIKLYDKKVFDQKLGNVSFKDSLSVSWTKSNLKTGGICEYSKRGASRMAEVKLSEDLKSASQLRDTLIKELCHAAAWVLNEDEPQETGWKLWAGRANQCLPELPLIEINYEYEYVYKCICCNLSSFARSQSRDIEKTYCAHCHAPIEEFLNKKYVNGNMSLVRLKKPSKYVQFVKKNYKLVKEEHPSITQVECMDILSETFEEYLPVQNKPNL